MDREIISFLESQEIATVCYLDAKNQPSCFSCYFAFNSFTKCIIFKTSSNATHSQLLKMNAQVSGTIHANNLSKINTKGIQFKGIAAEIEANNNNKDISIYYKKFPMAFPIPGCIWIISIEELKYTNKKLNIGNTLFWKNDSQ